MQNHFETFSRKRAIYAKTSCVKRGLFCNYNFSAHTKAAVQRAVLYLSPRRPRRLKDETAECKYRGSRRSNPCVNSSDSTSVRKKSTTSPPPNGAGYVWNSIDTVVVRDAKGCFNEFIRSEGKVPSGAGRKSDWGWVPVDRSQDQRRTWNSIDTLFRVSERGILQSRPD